MYVFLDLESASIICLRNLPDLISPLVKTHLKATNCDIIAVGIIRARLLLVSFFLTLVQ